MKFKSNGFSLIFYAGIVSVIFQLLLLIAPTTQIYNIGYVGLVFCLIFVLNGLRDIGASNIGVRVSYWMLIIALVFYLTPDVLNFDLPSDYTKFLPLEAGLSNDKLVAIIFAAAAPIIALVAIMLKMSSAKKKQTGLFGLLAIAIYVLALAYKLNINPIADAINSKTLLYVITAIFIVLGNFFTLKFIHDAA